MRMNDRAYWIIKWAFNILVRRTRLQCLLKTFYIYCIQHIHVYLLFSYYFYKLVLFYYALLAFEVSSFGTFGPSWETKLSVGQFNYAAVINMNIKSWQDYSCISCIFKTRSFKEYVLLFTLSSNLACILRNVSGSRLLVLIGTIYLLLYQCDLLFCIQGPQIGP